jgi:hypothetical protein
MRPATCAIRHPIWCLALARFPASLFFSVWFWLLWLLRNPQAASEQSNKQQTRRVHSSTPSSQLPAPSGRQDFVAEAEADQLRDHTGDRQQQQATKSGDIGSF